MKKISKTQFRRKRLGKTNYKKRLALLKGKCPRLVVRVSNKYITAQLFGYEPDGDKVLAQATSKDLEKLGWDISKSNTPASYLTGMLMASRAKDKKAILDIGFRTPKNNCRLFAFLKGAIDGGMDIPHSPSKFPDDSRINGEHIKEDIKKKVEAVKEKITGNKNA